jgi:putative transposase
MDSWHPAFLKLGNSLEECAKKYRGFCQRYKPKGKVASQSHWGSKLLAGIGISKSSGQSRSRGEGKNRNDFPAYQVSESLLVSEIARQFIEANRAPWEETKEF